MSHQDTKRIAKNTIFLYVRMIITMLITLYTSRVILNVLGVEDYGVYNIIAGIVVLLAFLQTLYYIRIGKRGVGISKKGIQYEYDDPHYHFFTYIFFS